jgi:hypothetical protein
MRRHEAMLFAQARGADVDVHQIINMIVSY